MFEDTKGVIWRQKSKKYRQYNAQKKTDKSANNDLQNTKQKTKDGAAWTPLKTGVELEITLMDCNI